MLFASDSPDLVTESFPNSATELFLRDTVANTTQLVSYVSDYMTLKPGDLIFTGTPEGVISGYPKDKQVWLKAGDKLVTSIDKLGDQHLTLT